MRGVADWILVQHSHFRGDYFGGADGLTDAFGDALGAGDTLAAGDAAGDSLTEGEAEAAGAAVAEVSGEAAGVALAAPVAEGDGLATGTAFRASASKRPVRPEMLCRAVKVVRIKVIRKKAPPR